MIVYDKKNVSVSSFQFHFLKIEFLYWKIIMVRVSLSLSLSLLHTHTHTLFTSQSFTHTHILIQYDPSHAKEGTSTAVFTGTSLRVIGSWKDGTERIEEYEKKTGELKVRKWRTVNALGRSSKWEFEIGEATTSRRPDGGGMLSLSSRNVRTR